MKRKPLPISIRVLQFFLKLFLFIPLVLYFITHRICTLIILFEMLVNARLRPYRHGYYRWRMQTFTAETPPDTFWKFIKFLYRYKKQIWDSALGGSSRRWGLFDIYVPN